jgi:hypothetical protein
MVHEGLDLASVSSWTGRCTWTTVCSELGRACEGVGRCNSHAAQRKATVSGSGDVLGSGEKQLEAGRS